MDEGTKESIRNESVKAASDKQINKIKNTAVKSAEREQKLSNSGKAMAKHMIIGAGIGFAVVFIGFAIAIGKWPEEIDTIEKARKGSLDTLMTYAYFAFGFAGMVGFIRGGTKMIDKWKNGNKGS